MITAIDLFAGLGGWSTGASHRLTVHMAGNAVPPVAGQRIIQALLAAA